MDRVFSEEDRRASPAISGNVMRHQYRTLNDQEKQFMVAVKDMGAGFHDALSAMGESRELSLAKTRIEEAVMWAVKHLTK